MRSEAGVGKTGIRARLLQFFTVLAVAACLAVLWGAASAPSVAPVRADVRPEVQRTSAATPSGERSAPDAAERGEPPAIREAHCDGGYWYWFERQQSSS